MADPLRDAVPPEAVETFLASLKRCLAVAGFLDRFYDAFLDSSDEVREKFRQTDFRRQTRVLAESLYVLAVAVQGREHSPARGDLPRIAARHGRGELDVRPGLYDTWLACLIDTARRHDAEFSPQVEAAWRATLTAGIDYMRARY